MKLVKILFIFTMLFCAPVIEAQTFKCVDVIYNANDRQSANQRIKISNQLLGTKAILTSYENKILAEMFDERGQKDASFVCEKFDNGFAKGYRYMLPNSIGAFVIEDIYPSVTNIQKFKIEIIDWDSGKDMTCVYIRR